MKEQLHKSIVGFFAILLLVSTSTASFGYNSQFFNSNNNFNTNSAIKSETKYKGSFVGKTNHRTVGVVTIEKTEDGYQIVFGEDFDFSGSPDPRVAFGKDGFKKETLVGKLKSNKGKQIYKVPESINPNDFNEVWIWCFKVDVPLGLAKLEKV